MSSATNSIRILAFGHIPKASGGRQQSGLANAMWSLARSITSLGEDCLVTFCATDVYRRHCAIDSIPVIGWTWYSLLLTIIRRPIRSAHVLIRLIASCRRYNQSILRTVLRAFLLRAAIDKVDPGYVHLHTCQAVIFLEAGITDPSRTFVTIHGVFGAAGPQELARMEAALTQIPLKFLGFVTAEIATIWRATFGVPQAPVVVIPNSYDADEFFPSEGPPILKGGKKASYKLVTIGSISNNKGQARVVEAIRDLVDTGHSYKIAYTAVGQSAPVGFAKEISTLAEESEIEFRHKNYLLPSEVRLLLWEADFMILASASEGFGLVFLESIACGTPIVLPKDLPICREPNIVSNTNAVLLESCSTTSILKFLERISEHQFVSSDVAASLPNYSWEAVGRRYRELLGMPSNESEQPQR